jgi:virulence factor Mce-like protein
MASQGRGLRWKRRGQGLAFLVIVALLLGFTVAIYNKSLPWQASDTVTLDTARIGDQLIIPADVKLRGLLVGRVSGAHTTGNVTSLTLKIQPSQMSQIPANVQARILPKTLFGEKFVDLVPPAQPSQVSFADMRSQGKSIVIHQDDSSTGIELQTVFTHLVPLLRALNPAQLSMTLNALATALQNRGEELGQNLVLTNQYFSVFNRDLPNFEHDISGLADLASNYADAAPHLLDILRNTTVTMRTFTEKADTYAQFLAGTAGFATEATKVIGDNSSRLIGLSRVSQPVLNLYSNYSINLECLANGLAIYDRTRLETAFNQGPFLHITLTPVNDRGQYTAAEKPSNRDFTKIAPNCDGLPYGHHGLHPIAVRYPGPTSDHFNEGGLAGDPASTSAPNGTTAGVGSAAEQRQIKALLRMIDPKVIAQHGFSPGLSDELLGPLLRGMAVGS